jgi:1-acyl-sn-glycerol-3-phosphate acyltransferase
MSPWDYGPGPSEFDLVRNNPAARLLRILVHVLLRLYMRWFHGVRPRRDGRWAGLRGHLIVANHASHLDALAMFCSFPLAQVNRIRSLCAKDYFFGHPLKRVVSFFLANTIPMDRDRFDVRAVAFCRRQMRKGVNILLFPEGTRSPDGRMGPFKPGVGLLALRYGLPVLPAAVRGACECWNRDQWLPRPGRIEVRFGRPVLYRGRNGRDGWEQVASDLQERVRRLGGPDAGENFYEQDTGPIAEDVDGLGGPVEQGASHRHRHRPDFRQDAGLRLSQPALGSGAGRPGPGSVIPVEPGLAGGAEPKGGA